jgi:hypothetical protein
MKLLGGSNLKVQKYTNVQKSQKGFTQTLYKAHLIMGQSETSTHPMHHYVGWMACGQKTFFHIYLGGVRWN